MNALRFAVLGHPIGHSLSPPMHRAAFSALGLPHTYEAIDVPDEAALAARVEEVRKGILAGVNVTVPHKIAVLSLVDEIDATAREVSAANTLVSRDGRVVAHNTDVTGLADDLLALGASPRTAAVIGSGGAALAAVLALRSLGARTIAVTSRSFTSRSAIEASVSASRLRRLLAEPHVFPRPDEAGEFGEVAAASDVIVQATPAGMRGIGQGELVAEAIPWDRLRKDALAYDLVYSPPVTPFLERAQRAGLRAAGGIGMLARQGAHAITLWLNVAVDAVIMQTAAEKALREVST